LASGFIRANTQGTMLLLVAGVQIGVIGFAGLDHLPQDFQKPLTQTSQRTRMAFAFRALLSVVNFGPGTNPQAALGPKREGVAQHFVALGADVNPVNWAGWENDRSGARDAWQGLGVLASLGMTAHFAQQSWRQSLACPWQGAKEVMVGMLFKERFNWLAVLVQLELQGVEQLGQTQSQQALGRGHGGGAAEWAGALEDFQPLGRRVRAP